MGRLNVVSILTTVFGEREEEVPGSAAALDETEEQRISRLRPCFRTDQRYSCTRRCKWSWQCKKLRAQWRH